MRRLEFWLTEAFRRWQFHTPLVEVVFHLELLAALLLFVFFVFHIHDIAPPVFLLRPYLLWVSPNSLIMNNKQQNNKERDTKLPMAFSSILCCSKNSIKIISCRVMCKTLLSETWSPNRFLIFCSSYLSTATPSQQTFSHKISTKVKATIIKSCWLAILNSCLNCYPKIL